jgi:hypothetical protein
MSYRKTSPLTSRVVSDCAVFEIEKGIPSAKAAAAIKFGLEELEGVSEVHFIGEDVQVVCDAGGVSLDVLLEAFEIAGFPRVRLHDVGGIIPAVSAPDSGTPVVTGEMSPPDSEEGLAAAG